MRESRTFRLFVSSTFSDLAAERDALQREVFPELQHLCELRGCRFQAIDLRWGVSEEAALDQQTMNICLSELRRCQDVSPRPNFLILLGDRYGWLPLPSQIEAAEFEAIRAAAPLADHPLLADWYRLDTNAAPPEYLLRPRREEVPAEKDYALWHRTEGSLHSILLDAVDRLGWPADDQRRIKYQCSATHQEIINGALAVPDRGEHVVAFLRTIENPEALPAAPYVDEGLNQARALKETIRNKPGIKHFDYTVVASRDGTKAHLAQFTADALVSLQRILEEEFRQLAPLDALNRERRVHQEFGADLGKHFVGRHRIRNEIAAYILGDNDYPMFIHGPAGCGKSALIAQAARDAAAAQQHACVIQRFIGATPRSADHRELLDGLVREIRDLYQAKPGAVPYDVKDLEIEFKRCFNLATVQRPLILFIDALDQLGIPELSLMLGWLPGGLPANVHIIASFLETDYLEPADAERPDEDAAEASEDTDPGESRSRGVTVRRLNRMTYEEGATLLQHWLHDARRGLTEEQQRRVLAGFRECPYPLYLRLAFEEARRWKSWEQAPALPGAIAGLVENLLARLRDKRHHGDLLVRTFLGLLSASRQGLYEGEVIKLLSDPEILEDLRSRSAKSPEAPEIPVVVWLRLYNDLAPYLLERSVENIPLMSHRRNRVIGEVIERHCLTARYHARLERFFRGKADPAADGTWAGDDTHALVELPFQQMSADNADLPVVALNDILFLHAKVKRGLLADLLGDYQRLLERQPRQANAADTLEYHRAAMLEQHHLRSDPRNAFQYLYNNLCWGSEPIRDSVNRARQRYLATGGNYLRQCREPRVLNTPLRMTLTGHTRAVNAGSFSPDGKVVVSGSDDKTIGLWDVHTGNQIATMCGHTDAVTYCRFSPDGGRVVSSGKDKTVRIWDGVAGRLLATLEGHDCSVEYCAFISEGSRIVSYSGGDGILLIRDSRTGEILVSTRTRRSGAFNSGCRFSPDGFLMAVWENWLRNATLTLINIKSGEKRTLLTTEMDQIHCCEFSPDGRRLVSGFGDTLKVWDSLTGHETAPLTEHVVANDVFAFSPDGSRMVSGGGRTLTLWDTEADRLIPMETLRGHDAAIQACEFSPDGRYVVSSSVDRTLRLWDTAASGTLATLAGHWDGIRHLTFSPDGERILSSGKDGSMKLWDTRGRELATLEGHTAAVMCAQFSADGGRIVSSSRDQTLRLWDSHTGRELCVLKGHEVSVTSCAWSPDDRRIVSAGGDATVRLWDAAAGKEVATLRGHGGVVECCAFSPDGSFIVTGGWDNTLKLWDSHSGAELATLSGHTGAVTACAVSQDGRWVLSASYDHTLKLWDRSTGHVVATLTGHRDAIVACAFSRDDGLIVSGSFDQTMRVWDRRNGTEVLTLCGDAAVSAVSLSPNSRLIACGDVMGNFFLFCPEGLSKYDHALGVG